MRCLTIAAKRSATKTIVYGYGVCLHGNMFTKSGTPMLKIEGDAELCIGVWSTYSAG
jgi:hypothetical protein